MNNFKKFASLLLALMLLLTMAVPAMAEEITYTLSLDGAQSGHTYSAYQIFAGDLSGDTLSNIVWGSGVTEAGKEALGNAAAKAETLKTVADAEAFAAVVAPYLSTAAGSATVANGATTCEISGLKAGYYLVKTTNVTSDNGVYTYYIMKIVKNTNATVKADVPEVEKTVDDNDANIGDTVTFTLTATMPSNIQGYETYKVIFHDTMSEGLTYAGDDQLTVKIGDKDVTEQFTVVDTVDATTGKTTLTVSCDNVLAEAVGATADSEIVVTYKATVNENAVIGTDGNINKVKLEYSNNPNGEGTGKTPEEEVKVYTWEIPVFKWTAGEENAKTPLAGAGFTLYKDKECTQAVNLVAANNNSYKVCTQTGCTHTHVTEIITDDTGKFEIEGLEKDTYYLKETTTPAGYNTCDVVTVVIGENGALTMNGTGITGDVEIENKAGSTLPETGGMGTTLFYALGSLLVVGAVVVMISKKRAASK